MRIIIVGAGEVGYHIAKTLSEEKHDVVLIDNDPKKIRRISENLDVQTLWGSGTSPQMLKDAGIEEAEMLVAATNSDEVNLISCMLVRNLNQHTIKIARVKNREYLALKDLFNKEHLGIDLIINTRAMMVDTVLSLINVPGASEVIDFVGGKVKLISFLINRDSPFAEKRLSSLSGLGNDILIGAIVRGQKILIPSGKDIIHPHDLVYFVVRGSDVSRTLEHLNIPNKPITNIVIVGAGETGAALASALDEKRLRVKLIDDDSERCKQMANMLNHVIIIKGDGADRDLLREENVGCADLLIALTGDEESNILISLLAKGMGIQKTITRVSKLSYIPVVSDIGLDTVINPRMAAVRAILHHIRHGKIISVAPLREEHAEAIEVEALETSDIVNTPLKKLNFPEGAILGAIVRGEDIIIPQGDTVILPHDRLIIFALQQVISDLEKLFMVKMEYF
ncbi:MAG: Trk system potassium uptake protein TrkA [Smithella sp. PtaU1.Bin162]|nr:MAG: Trk system potassium uptake protein TrkA [Smithella sp. PtaU1.Bin162]